MYKKIEGAEREQFGSRLGFILVTAGSAIGLGNIWRFPNMAGSNGGAVFIALYILILLCIGLPVLLTEMSLGRGSRKSLARCFEALEPVGTKWHWAKYPMIFGNYVVMCYYPVITGWIIYYLWGIASDNFFASPNTSKEIFSEMISHNNAWVYVSSMVCVAFCAIVGWFGVNRGIEKITKPMMMILLLCLVALVIYALCLPNAMVGVKAYLVPDFSTISFSSLLKTANAALGQAFFTLGLGVGIILTLASYMDKRKSLVSESLVICSLDTIVAIGAGLIIFPACASFGLETTSGPSLLFDSMLTIFRGIPQPAGYIFGTTFFVLMVFAALTSVLSIFENMLAITMDALEVGRKKAVLINTAFLLVAVIPAILSFSLLKDITVFGLDILSAEDYLFSNILMPFGALIMVIFCLTRYGWHTNSFYKEVNSGDGLKLAYALRYYIRYFIPLMIVVVFLGANVPDSVWQAVTSFFTGK